MKLEPRQLNEEEAKRLGVTPGWWAVDEIGTPVLGPHPSREGALVGIAKSGRRDSDIPETNVIDLRGYGTSRN
ncbi:hypothetical protein ACUSIJ_22780 [Pseudochelatococcus sp. B33]